MKSGKSLKWVGLWVVALAAVAGGRFYLLRKDTTQDRPVLKVGFLPVTCHLTCPVTDFATKMGTKTRFESQRFTDWPSVAEAFKSGRLKATFFVAPLAMKLREQGVKGKIVYLGHRDGSTIIVPTKSTARSMRDLKGKTFAVPSKFSNQYLVAWKVMQDQGLSPSDFKFVEVPPPEMPAALAAGSIDAYFTGEQIGRAHV